MPGIVITKSLFIYLFIYLSIHYPFIHSFIYPSIYWFIHLFTVSDFWCIFDEQQGSPYPSTWWPGASKIPSWASGFCQIFILNFLWFVLKYGKNQNKIWRNITALRYLTITILHTVPRHSHHHVCIWPGTQWYQAICNCNARNKDMFFSKLILLSMTLCSFPGTRH